MAKVNLAKALKMKNALVGELNRAKEILTRENSRLTTTSSTVDREVMYKEIQEKTQSLIALKTAIATANVGLYAYLSQMAEAKAAIAYLKSLNTTDGVVKTQGHFSAAEIVNTYSAFFTQQKVDYEVGRLQKLIETTQDNVDAFNGSTFIEV